MIPDKTAYAIMSVCDTVNPIFLQGTGWPRESHSHALLLTLGVHAQEGYGTCVVVWAEPDPTLETQEQGQGPIG